MTIKLYNKLIYVNFTIHYLIAPHKKSSQHDRFRQLDNRPTNPNVGGMDGCGFWILVSRAKRAKSPRSGGLNRLEPNTMKILLS